MKKICKCALATALVIGIASSGGEAWSAPCADKADCEKKAVAAFQGKKFPEALKAATRGCKGGSPASCYIVGVLYWQGAGVKKSPKKTAKFFTRACDLKHAGACYNLGVLHRDGVGVKKSGKKGLKISIKACELGYNDGCLNAGVMLLKGQGVKKDVKRSAGIFKKGCDKGHKKCCTGAELAKKEMSGGGDSGSDGVTDANVTVGSMTVNGFTIKDMKCKITGGGFLASAMVVGSLGKRKKLKHCGKKGKTPKVVWVYAGGKARVLSVTGASGKAKKCIRAEMKKVRAGSLAGKCEGLFVMGK